MSVNLGGELIRCLVMTNDAHGRQDAPVSPRDAESREAAAWAAPRVSVVEFAPVGRAAQLARLLEAAAPGEAAAQVRELELGEADEPAEVGVRVRPPERVQAREPAPLRGAYSRPRHAVQVLDSRNSRPAESQQSVDCRDWRPPAIEDSSVQSVHAAAGRG